MAETQIIGWIKDPSSGKLIPKTYPTIEAAQAEGARTITNVEVGAGNTVANPNLKPPGTYQNDPQEVAKFQKYIGFYIVGRMNEIPPEYLPLIQQMEDAKGLALTGADQGNLGRGRLQLPTLTSQQPTAPTPAPTGPTSAPTPKPLAPQPGGERQYYFPEDPNRPKPIAPQSPLPTGPTIGYKPSPTIGYKPSPTAPVRPGGFYSPPKPVPTTPTYRTPTIPALTMPSSITSESLMSKLKKRFGAQNYYR